MKKNTFRKIMSAVLSVAMLGSMMMLPANAVVPGEDAVTLTTTYSKALYDEAINSTIFVNDMVELEGQYGNVVLKVELLDEIITLGYSGLISYEEIYKEINKEVSYLSEMYSSNRNATGVSLNTESVKYQIDMDDVFVESVGVYGDITDLDLCQKYSNIFTMNSFTTELVNNSIADTYAIVPGSGDNETRFEDGELWHPDFIQADFRNNFSDGQNRVAVYYEYINTSGRLDNLVQDDDEGLEIDVTFYNYGENYGTTYIEGYEMTDTSVVWASNQPTAYLDTQFVLPGVMGNTNELPFCVGVEDASLLTYGKYYYWTIRHTSGVNNGNTYDGAFKISCQRTYEDVSVMSQWGSIVDGAEDEVTWKRFAEKKEGTLYPKVEPSATNNWDSTSAWVYAANFDEWGYVSSTDPIKQVK